MTSKPILRLGMPANKESVLAVGLIPEPSHCVDTFKHKQSRGSDEWQCHLMVGECIYVCIWK